MEKKHIVYNIGLILLFIQVATCLQITNLSVPSPYILNRNELNVEPLILDCEYEVPENATAGFVLKWKHNGLQIYQYIPSRTPTALQSFRNRVDLDYPVSENRFQRYRALKIDQPLMNFTGDYTCSVQTFEGNDQKTAHLDIIVPESEFNLTFNIENNGSTIVNCGAKDIFPEPELFLFIGDDVLGEIVPTINKGEDGLYDISLQYVLANDENDAAIFCHLIIPGTNYTKIKDKMYHGDASRASVTIIRALLYSAFVFATSALLQH